jgi:hypothetical protein
MESSVDIFKTPTEIRSHIRVLTMAMAANYPHRIASIAERNQGLPPVLFDVLNLDRVIEANSAIQEADLRIAEGLVDGLKGARGRLTSEHGLACADLNAQGSIPK